jgi:hypothetical protein
MITCFISRVVLYTTDTDIVSLILCVHNSHTFVALCFSLYAVIHIFHPLLLCLFAADIHVSSFLCVYAAEIRLSSLLYLYAALYTFLPLVPVRSLHSCLIFFLFLYAVEIRVSFPLCLHAAEIVVHVSTTAVSIRSRLAEFVPTCRV